MNGIVDEYYSVENGIIYRHITIEDDDGDFSDIRESIQDEQLVILDADKLPILEKMVHIIDAPSNRDTIFNIIRDARRRLNLDKLLNE